MRLSLDETIQELNKDKKHEQEINALKMRIQALEEENERYKREFKPK